MKHLVGSLIFCAVLVAPVVSALGGSHWPGALGRHHGKFWKREEVRRELELTEDEVGHLEQILARSRQALVDLKADVKKKRADLDALLADDRADNARILAQVDLLEHARANLGKARVIMLLAMRNVLTPAQRARLAHLKEEHEGRKAGDGEHDPRATDGETSD